MAEIARNINIPIAVLTAIVNELITYFSTFTLRSNFSWQSAKSLNTLFSHWSCFLDSNKHVQCSHLWIFFLTKTVSQQCNMIFYLPTAPCGPTAPLSPVKNKIIWWVTDVYFIFLKYMFHHYLVFLMFLVVQRCQQVLVLLLFLVILLKLHKKISSFIFLRSKLNQTQFSVT